LLDDADLSKFFLKMQKKLSEKRYLCALEQGTEGAEKFGHSRCSKELENDSTYFISFTPLGH